ncbi:MAG: type II toxin-antitoxin system prevent-host-death family antitoxin [Luteolibacter sp.]
MKVVSTHEAKTHLSRLLDEASVGEEIVIAKAGQPVARLVRYEVAKKPRKLGALKGKIVESSDCWEPDAEA